MKYEKSNRTRKKVNTRPRLIFLITSLLSLTPFYEIFLIIHSTITSKSSLFEEVSLLYSKADGEFLNTTCRFYRNHKPMVTQK